MKNKFIRNAFLFSALIFSLTFFFSCNNMANINGGSISLTLPGATSREGEGSVEYIFNVSLEGETSQSKTGISGQTVVFEDLDVGDYEVKVEAFEKATGYVYAQGSEKTTILAGQISYVTVYLQKVWLEPTITKQPEDKTVNLIKTDATSGAAQGSVTLSIEAEVNQGGDLSYLWQKLEGGEWEIVERNSADYTLNFTTENANQTYQYRCRVFHNEGASGALNEEEGTGRTCFVDSRIVTVTVGGVKTLTGISARFKDGANEYYTIGGTGEAFSRFYNDLILTETYSDGTSLEITPDMNLYPANPVDTSCQIGDLTIKLFPTVKPEISCTISSKWKYESVLPTLSVTEPSSLGEITLGGSEASSFNLTYNVGVTTPSSYKCTDGKSYSDTLSYQWYYWKVTEDTPTGEERVVTPIGIQSEAPTATFTPTEAGEYEFYLQLILSCSAYSTTPGETKKSTPVIICSGTVTESATPDPTPSTGSITTWSALSAAVTSADAGDTLTVFGNMTADSTIEISRELTIVAAGSGCTITRGDGFYTTEATDGAIFFHVLEGGDLTLGGSGGTLTLDGGYKNTTETQSTGAIVRLYQSKTTGTSNITCKLTLKSGCVIQNNYNKSASLYQGGGVCYSNSATVACKNSEGLVLDGCTIKNCIGRQGGGVYFFAGAKSTAVPKLIIQGTTLIDGNSTVNDNTGLNGGGIYLGKGYLAMSAGTISSNIGNAGQQQFDTVATYGGGGIFSTANGIIEITGGTITGNEAHNCSGGGIFSNGKLTISGNTTINGNKSGGNSTTYYPNICKGTNAWTIGGISINSVNGTYTSDTARTYTYVEDGELKTATVSGS